MQEVKDNDFYGIITEAVHIQFFNEGVFRAPNSKIEQKYTTVEKFINKDDFINRLNELQVKGITYFCFIGRPINPVLKIEW